MSRESGCFNPELQLIQTVTFDGKQTQVWLDWPVFEEISRTANALTLDPSRCFWTLHNMQEPVVWLPWLPFQVFWAVCWRLTPWSDGFCVCVCVPSILMLSVSRITKEKKDSLCNLLFLYKFLLSLFTVSPFYTILTMLLFLLHPPPHS